MTDNKTLSGGKKEEDRDIIIKNGKTYYNNMFYDMKLKKSNIKNAGLGVFSQVNIDNKVVIGEYDGKLVKSTDKYNADYTMQITEKIYVDGSKYPRPFTSMINDTYKTNFKHNCEFVIREKKQKVLIRTIRPIKKGDELYIDYGEEYWTSRE
uniref:SET domain-containing protein n=1 Tax=viral metagenome TaxID=1070528 RepID=A0A6C0EB79_9ZZZZ